MFNLIKNSKMKLVNKTNKMVRQGLPFIFMRLGGYISFSRKLTEVMGLKAGVELAFFQDIENPEDWYIKANEKGMKLRKGNGDDIYGGLAANNADLCRQILEPLGLEKSRIMVGIEPVKDGYFPIITSSAK